MNGIWCVIGVHMLGGSTTFGRQLGMQLPFIN